MFSQDRSKSNKGDPFKVYDHVFSTEPITNMTVPDSAALGDALVVMDKWRSQWNQPVQVVSEELSLKTLPAPRRRRAPSLQRFQRPPAYITWSGIPEHEQDEVVEYTLTDDDIAWMHAFNRGEGEKGEEEEEEGEEGGRRERRERRTRGAVGEKGERKDEGRKGRVGVEEGGRAEAGRLREEQLERLIDRFEKDSEHHLSTMAQSFSSPSRPSLRPRPPSLSSPHPPSSLRGSFLKASYSVAQSPSQAMGVAICEEDLRDSIHIPSIAARLSLPPALVCAASEHWIRCRAAVSFRPLLIRFFKPTISEILSSDRISLRNCRRIMAKTLRNLHRLRNVARMVAAREALKREQVSVGRRLSFLDIQHKAASLTTGRAFQLILQDALSSSSLPPPPLPSFLLSPSPSSSLLSSFPLPPSLASIIAPPPSPPSSPPPSSPPPLSSLPNLRSRSLSNTHPPSSFPPPPLPPPSSSPPPPPPPPSTTKKHTPLPPPSPPTSPLSSSPSPSHTSHRRPKTRASLATKLSSKSSQQPGFNATLSSSPPPSSSPSPSSSILASLRRRTRSLSTALPLSPSPPSHPPTPSPAPLSLLSSQSIRKHRRMSGPASAPKLVVAARRDLSSLGPCVSSRRKRLRPSDA